MSTPETETASEFTLPEVYKGMHEYFGGDLENYKKDVIAHYMHHLEVLDDFMHHSRQAGKNPNDREFLIVKAAIQSLWAEVEIVTETDSTDTLGMFQVQLKHAALINEVQELEDEFGILFTESHWASIS